MEITAASRMRDSCRDRHGRAAARASGCILGNCVSRPGRLNSIAGPAISCRVFSRAITTASGNVAGADLGAVPMVPVPVRVDDVADGLVGEAPDVRRARPPAADGVPLVSKTSTPASERTTMELPSRPTVTVRRRTDKGRRLQRSACASAPDVTAPAFPRGQRYTQSPRLLARSSSWATQFPNYPITQFPNSPLSSPHVDNRRIHRSWRDGPAHGETRDGQRPSIDRPQPEPETG